MRCAAFVVVLVALSSSAVASPVHGLVFVDRDGDGQPGASEPGQAGVVVAFGNQLFTTTDAQGQFTLDVPDGAEGQLWARVPDGFAPGPVWAAVPAFHADASFDLALRPLPADFAPTAVRFVVAADTHMQAVANTWSTPDLVNSIEQATQTDPAPLFFTILGDLTNGSDPKQFQEISDALKQMDVPWVPVPGNHDWVDKGASYRATMGPENYSFDAGGVHFLVWNTNDLTDDDTIAFIQKELALVDPKMTIVALGHAPPHQKVVDAMIAAGVDYMFCGHWHSNRVIDHGGLIELDTEPFVMGGIDFSPAGYRVVTIQDGKMQAEHGTVVDGAYARVIAPATDACAGATDDLVVAADVGAGATSGGVAVSATIDGLPPVSLSFAGGWDFHAPMSLGPGAHHVHVVAEGPAGATTADADFQVCDAPAATRAGGEWPMTGGGPTHQGARGDDLAPPLATAWTSVLGGHVHMGAPVVWSGHVFVSVSDFANGDQGGVVALDLATGRSLWRWRAPLPVRNAPAVADGVLVVGEDDGTVVALDARDGTQLWSVALGEADDPLVHTLWASPTIADGVVYVGTQHHMMALDLRTGATEWENNPVPNGDWLGSFAAAAVDGGVVVDTFHRDVGGVIAWDEATGKELWRLTGEQAVAVEASPLIVDDRVFVCNGADKVEAIDLASGPGGTNGWEATLDGSGGDWTYAIAGTPAYADGRLFVATQLRDLVALDATTGAELWRHGATQAAIHATHYQGHTDGYLGGPVVTGGVVWIGGADGLLTALEAATGKVVWTKQLDAPVMSSMAVAGDYLIVATYDGTIRAFAAPPPPVAAAPAGCGCRAAGPVDASPLVLVLLVLVRRRRARA